MMAKDQSSTIKGIAKEFGNDRHRLMDIALKVQSQLGQISEETMETIAGAMSIPLVEVRDMVSF
jgi:NADH:ubiquinone oxidoreductase subunit E